MNILHETVVVEPDMLDVGIKVITCSEPLGDKFALYFQVVTWFGADSSIQATSDKVYLMGKYQDIEQTIKVELPEEGIKEVSDKWHDIGVTYATELKKQLKLQFFAAVAERL